MSKKRIPVELLFEICHFLPFRLRWATDRVALAFDHFVLKFQCVWIKAKFERQIKIAQRKQLLTIAKRELSKVTKKLLDDELSLMSATIGCNFYVGSNHGVTGTDFLGMTSLEIFTKNWKKSLPNVSITKTQMPLNARREVSFGIKLRLNYMGL
ncbi:hypothetical protein niasHT_021221 [Heterodera trifolii]|uniref:Uncharacterized protein n=1 Tax=Heterodera trifolii TaxID=157864 RepID=A0ABD2JWJ0_9BILA